MKTALSGWEPAPLPGSNHEHSIFTFATTPLRVSALEITPESRDWTRSMSASLPAGWCFRLANAAKNICHNILKSPEGGDERMRFVALMATWSFPFLNNSSIYLFIYLSISPSTGIENALSLLSLGFGRGPDLNIIGCENRLRQQEEEKDRKLYEKTTDTTSRKVEKKKTTYENAFQDEPLRPEASGTADFSFLSYGTPPYRAG